MAAAALAEPQGMSLTPFQERVIVTQGECDLFLGGGLGGGKSTADALLFLRHAEQYGQRARMLFIRRSFPGVADFELMTREVFSLAYGRGASYNAKDHLWRFPNGGTLQLDQFETLADFGKFQGKSFTLIVVDEAEQYSDPAILDLPRSCLRAPAPINPRMVLSANPGDRGHGWLARRHVFKAAPWTRYTEEKSGRTFINCPSMQQDSRKALLAADRAVEGVIRYIRQKTSPARLQAAVAESVRLRSMNAPVGSRAA